MSDIQTPIIQTDILRCAYCGEPVGGDLYRFLGKPCCDRCASIVRPVIESSKFEPSRFAIGVAAGVGAGIACAIAWAAIAYLTKSSWGIAGAAAGFVIASVIVRASGGIRGRSVQFASGLISAITIILGKLFWITWMLYREHGIPIPQAFIRTLQASFSVPKDLFDPFDFVWIGIAIYVGWRVARSVPMELLGPFRTGDGTSSLRQTPNPSPPPVSAPVQAKSDPLPMAVFKTVGSMLVSILVYGLVMENWWIAIGFVLLILVHELGHVVCNAYYGIRAAPPIFIPFLGAVINLRQLPPNAKVEAIIGIGGPIAGTIAALGCFIWWRMTNRPEALALSWFGFALNLFNMLPVPPLDGGRIAAAISPKVWILGLVGLGWLVFNDIQRGQDFSLLLVLLVMALPRIIMTIKAGARRGPYYDIRKTDSIMIAVAYLLLLGVLIGFRWYTTQHRPAGGFF